MDSIEGEQIFNDAVDIKYLFKPGQTKKLLVIFSGFNSPEATRQLSYNYIRTLSGLNCNKLYILDDPDPRGSYYIGNITEKKQEKSVISLINHYMNTLNLDYSDIISCGSSKGGTAAIYFGYKYSFGNIIAGGPQIYINKYLEMFDHTKSTLEFMIGDKSNSEKLDDQILSLLNPKMETKLQLFSSKSDWQYESHIMPFIEKLNQNKLEYELTMSDYPSHGEIGSYFAQFLKRKLYALLHGIEDISIDISVQNKLTSLQCNTNTKIVDVTYAFYLIVDGVAVSKKWYSNENHAEFDLIYDKNKSHGLHCFVKDKYGNVHLEKYNLSRFEIDFIPDFRIEQGNIICSIETDQNDVEFAYYFQLNDNPIQKTWYSQSKENHFKINDEEISKFKIEYFFREKEKLVAKKHFNFIKHIPESNKNRETKKFDFFIDNYHNIIYKKITNKKNKLSNIIDIHGSLEKYREIISGQELPKTILKYTKKGYSVESDGSYKSEIISGYRLDIISEIIEKYPSIVRAMKIDFDNIKRQVNKLIADLTIADSNGKLIGDWALHNLIYSPSDDRIYNIDLEGFMTYNPIPEWANLNKIKLWLNQII